MNTDGAMAALRRGQGPVITLGWPGLRPAMTVVGTTLTFPPPAPTFRAGSDGRAVALALRRGGGKSGLHGDKAAGNARRG